MIGINEKKNQHISIMSMPNKDQLQTPTQSISNDDSSSRAPPHKNTVQVGATVDTSKKPKASEDANACQRSSLSSAVLDQERQQKFENEYNRQIRHPFPQIRVRSDTPLTAQDVERGV